MGLDVEMGPTYDATGKQEMVLTQIAIVGEEGLLYKKIAVQKGVPSSYYNGRVTPEELSQGKCSRITMVYYLFYCRLTLKNVQ